MDINAPIEKAFRLTGVQRSALRKLGIVTARDLLFHFPARYADIPKISSITDLTPGENAVIYGHVVNIKKTQAFKTRMVMTTAVVADATGKISAVWFHQPYIADKLKEGSLVQLHGRVQFRKGDKEEKYLANPEFEETAIMPIDILGSLFENSKAASVLHKMPIYPESRGITSRWFLYAVKKVLAACLSDRQVQTHDVFPETLPADILAKYHLPPLLTALVWIHHPKNENDALAARKRFAFEEIFLIQLERQRARREFQSNPAFVVQSSPELIADFIKRFPFELTASQSNAIAQIMRDFARGIPMSRLLEGDVGSGKTAVAAATAYAITATRSDFGNLQVAIMAPTEILAAQHFESCIRYFSHLSTRIALITSSGCRIFPSKVDPNRSAAISKTQLLKWVANGEIPIVIGTHALIQKSVQFKRLAYTIIDEQHRFGTHQRLTFVRRKIQDKHEASAEKSALVPHLLSMTATPIPRTLALTIYGDLDLTLLAEMPHGRKPIITEIVPPEKRDTAYDLIKKELAAGRQAYVICPRIDEPDPEKELALNTTSVTAEAERLKRDVFKRNSIAVIHSKMKPLEKDRVMAAFVEQKIDILVATSVIEVGVNVPNATMIVIEGAERFGLAQLHQLRGRVIRSNRQAFCFAMSEAKTASARKRLKAFVAAKNGFELAELDLAMRGAGDLYGRKQWGISDLGMEAIKNIKMVEAAQTEAHRIIEHDLLKTYPDLEQRLNSQSKKIHFE